MSTDNEGQRQMAVEREAAIAFILARLSRLKAADLDALVISFKLKGKEGPAVGIAGSFGDIGQCVTEMRRRVQSNVERADAARKETLAVLAKAKS